MRTSVVEEKGPAGVSLFSVLPVASAAAQCRTLDSLERYTALLLSASGGAATTTGSAALRPSDS